MRPRRRGQEEGSDLAPGGDRPAGRWGAGPEPPGTDPAARGLTSVPEAVPWTSEPHTSPRPCVDCVTPRGAASSAGSGHRRAWSPVADISRAGAGRQGAGVDVSQASRTGESGCEPFGPGTQGQRPGPPPRDARLATPCVRGGPAARRPAAPHSQTSWKGHALQAKKVRSPKYGSRAPDVWGGGPGRATPSTPSLCFQNITARGGDSGQPEGTGGLRSACFPSAAADTSSWAWDRAPQPQAPGGRPRGVARAAAGPGMLPGGTGLGVESPRCPLEKLRTRNRFESVTTAQPCPQAAFLPPVSSFH